MGSEISPGDLGRESLSSDEQTVTNAFEEGIAAARPYLFHLAQQVVDGYREHKWDILIGDDTSGRLMTHFVRSVLKGQGISLPAAFICASHTAQKGFPSSAYEMYVEHIADSAAHPQHPLVVSDNSLTGGTLRFIDGHLRRCFETVDFAVGALRFDQPIGVTGTVYAGGVGPETARAMYMAFERAGQKSIGDIAVGAVGRVVPLRIRQMISGRASVGGSTHYMTNIVAPQNMAAGVMPVAVRVKDDSYRRAAFHCYLAMERLAQDFNDLQPKPADMAPESGCMYEMSGRV